MMLLQQTKHVLYWSDGIHFVKMVNNYPVRGTLTEANAFVDKAGALRFAAMHNGWDTFSYAKIDIQYHLDEDA